MEVWARQDFEKAENEASMIAEYARLDVSFENVSHVIICNKTGIGITVIA